MVFCDIDGCLGDFIKPEYPHKQDLDNNKGKLELIKEKRKQFNEILFGVATGRSFYQADNIMESTAHQGPSIFEMGNVIFDPEEGVYNLFERHEKLCEHKAVIQEFIEWKRELSKQEQDIKNRFAFANLRQIKDRTCMLTYEFDSDIANELYSFLQEFMPENIKNSIDNQILKVLFSENSLDIMPNLNKGDAVEFISKKYGIDKNEILAIGDSSHSDIDLLKAAGFMACPDNADEELKEFVLSSGKGFIAPNNSATGVLNILDILEHFSRFNNFTNSKKKILVIGDYCIDEFFEGETNSISPEAPIPRVLISSVKSNPGMAGNIVAGMCAFGLETHAVGIIGEDENSKDLINFLKNFGANTDGMILQKERITSKFSRIVVGGKKYPQQSAIRFDFENIESPSSQSLAKIMNYINNQENINTIVVADYDEVGNGIINEEFLQQLVAITKQKGIRLIGDSRKNFNWFKDFSCIVPNISEAELTYEKLFNEKPNASLAESITSKLNLESIIITKDKDGLEIFTRNGEKANFPALAKKVVDVTGAGDSVTCALTCGLSMNKGYVASAKLACYAAAIAVSKPKLAIVTLNEIESFAKEIENEK